MRLYSIIIILACTVMSCSKGSSKENKETKENVAPIFHTVDTDFSKGRLSFEQTVDLGDLERFHGHLCDGLLQGALSMQEAMKVLYPNQAIDRTNLRIVSKPSPCLTDVAIYISGGRYQFNTFYVDTDFEGEYIIQRIDDLKTVSVGINKGVKPSAIDSLGNIAIAQKLSPCDIDRLRQMEDDFTVTLRNANPADIFTVKELPNFEWRPKTKNDYIKSDVINKNLPECK